MKSSRIVTSLAALTLLTALAACGDTWRGLKTDTGQNLERSGEAIENTGERVNPNPPR